MFNVSVWACVPNLTWNHINVASKMIFFSLQNVLNGAPTEQDVLWNVAKDQHTPKVTTFQGPEIRDEMNKEVEKQVYGPTSEILAKSVSVLYFFQACIV